MNQHLVLNIRECLYRYALNDVCVPFHSMMSIKKHENVSVETCYH